MKTRNVFATVCLLAVTLTAISQAPAAKTYSPDSINEPVRSNIQQPEFAGMTEGESLQEYIDEHLRIPNHIQNWEILAPLVIRFRVLPNREITDFQVIQSVVSDFDEAVLELLESTNGMWKPGMINGRPVPMEKELRIILNTSNKDAIELYMSAQWDKNRADKLLKKGKYRRAIKFYSRSIESFPSCVESLYRRGLAKYNKGDVEGAFKDFERVTDLGSHLADEMLAKFNK